MPVESVVRFGDPAEEIVREADAFDADLIAVTTEDRGWFGHLMGGSPTACSTRPTSRVLMLGKK